MSTITAQDRIRIADRLGLNEQYLYQCMTGRGAMSPVEATRIEFESDQELRRWHLRPKDWHRIWPELVGLEGAPAVPEEEVYILPQKPSDTPPPEPGMAERTTEPRRKQQRRGTVSNERRLGNDRRAATAGKEGA